MTLDLRFPLGLLFTFFGLVLSVYGAARPELRTRLADVNVNLYAGLLMLAFGLLMLWLGRARSGRRDDR